MCGIFLLLISAILWIWLQLAVRVTKLNELTDTSTAPDVVTVDRFPASLGSLTDIVPVLNLAQIAAKQDSVHSPEFQGTSFMGAHESDWTLQVMNVSQETVITDFLAKRSDRTRFQYFRYHSAGKPESFILTYGAFTTVETAMGALRTMDFGLPETVKVFPERFSTYKPFVTDSDGAIAGDPANMQRQVKLRPVSSPPPADAIEDKLAQIAAQSASTSSAPTALPSGVDGFSGQPDAPPPEPAVSQTPTSKTSRDTVSPAAIQDPFN
jgi:hypothetical protein